MRPILIACLITLLCSCDQQPTEPDPTLDFFTSRFQYFPVMEYDAETWEYSGPIDDARSFWGIPYVPTNGSRELVRAHGRMQSDVGKGYWVWLLDDGIGRENGGRALSPQEDGVWRGLWNEDREEITYASLVLPRHPELRDTWSNWSDSAYRWIREYHYMVTDVGIRVIVPGGTFECVEVTQINSDRTLPDDAWCVSYFSETAGLIKAIRYDNVHGADSIVLTSINF